MSNSSIGDTNNLLIYNLLIIIIIENNKWKTLIQLHLIQLHLATKIKL